MTYSPYPLPRRRAAQAVALALAAAVALAGLQGAQAQSRHRLDGVVLGPAGPVAGARITARAFGFQGSQDPLQEVSTATGGDGRFTVFLIPGVFDLAVDGPAGSALAGESFAPFLLTRDLEARVRLRSEVTVRGSARLSPSSPWSPRVELRSLTRDRTFPAGMTGSAFEARVPADLYSVHTVADCGFHDCRGFAFSRINVDARNGPVSGVEVPLPDGGPVLTSDPPWADRITLGPADPAGMATLRGAPGAVEPLATVLGANLQTAHLQIASAAADGSFSLPIFAPPGSFIQVKHDPTALYLAPGNLGSGGSDALEAAPGTILHQAIPGGPTAFASVAPVEPFLVTEGISVTQAETFGVLDPGQVVLSGDLGGVAWAPGGRVTLSGRLVVTSKDLATTDPAEVLSSGRLRLERLFDGHGRQTAASAHFSSFDMTPTGLPIERTGGYVAIGGAWSAGTLTRAAADRFEGPWQLSGSLPPELPPGIYRAIVDVGFQGIPSGGRHFGRAPTSEPNTLQSPGTIGLVRIGTPQPPKLTWVLALDELSNGARGVVALEDRGRFAPASHVLTHGDTAILERDDPRTGERRVYGLEPYVPLISVSNARVAGPPRIPFRFPSGSLTVRLEKPDGSVLELGSAPFSQSRSRTPLSPSGRTLSPGTNHPTEYFQLITRDPRFQVAFEDYGRHLVTLRGEVEDVWGNRYEGGGSYEIFVARSLDLETGVMPGTPFEVGDAFNPAVAVGPAVGARIEVDLLLLPDSDPARAVRRRVEGRANRFGYFQPVSGEPLTLSAAGEYRVDIRARYLDPEGVLWMGTMTWGGIVETPASPLVTRGRRGFDGVDGIQQQWFRVREARAGGDHVMFPFHRGDVMWMEKLDPAADIPKITIQDPQGDFADLVRLRSPLHPGGFEPPGLEERILAGEIPLFSSADSGLDVTVDPGTAGHHRAYFYSAVERPGVRVREMISEDNSGTGYWRFTDAYHLQSGAGISGDLTNDFKLQFGGAVYRSADFRYYGAYASLFVLLPHDDAEGGRVFPPFQGAGGGPSGGPIFTLQGQEVDLFFHPTGLGPGTVLEVGNRASLSGQVAPPLPARLEFRITEPAGSVRTLTGRANKVGYFYQPGDDFFVEAPGTYRVAVRVVYDGLTSAGPVEAPFPEGSVLGAPGGAFSFYAVDRDSPPLAVDRPPGSFVQPAAGRVPMTVDVVPGRSVQYTVRMPGFLLEEGTSTTGRYSYDAPVLQQSFPNLDLTDLDGRYGSDTVTFSFFDGEAMPPRARRILLQGEELLAPPQALALCSAAADALCLGGDRFEVRVSWRDSRGNRGIGRTVPTATGDSGLFWFFREANWEMLVKVLDGCAANGHFWVFSAATTNVGYTLTVTDTVTGAARSYTNPPGTSAPAVTDTEALATCGAPSGTHGSGRVATAASLRPRLPTGTMRSSDPCIPGNAALCLQDGRFRVEVAWKDRSGRRGIGRVVPIGSSDSGLFWFFRETNWEMLVKVLDGCTANGHFWVFSAATTNVEYTLRVTDTASGEVAEYFNPLGAAAAAITDTRALASCP